VLRRSTLRLPDVLKRARLAAKLSLRAVEKRTGISNAYLSQLENGKTSNPSPPILAKLARAYEMSYPDLLIAAGYLESPSNKGLSRRITMLASDLSTDEQAAVEKFVTFLRAQRK